MKLVGITASTVTNGIRETSSFEPNETIHVRELCPEREAAIERKVEVLENVHSAANGMSIMLDEGEVIDGEDVKEALEAWRKANE